MIPKDLKPFEVLNIGRRLLRQAFESALQHHDLETSIKNALNTLELGRPYTHLWNDYLHIAYDTDKHGMNIDALLKNKEQTMLKTLEFFMMITKESDNHFFSKLETYIKNTIAPQFALNDTYESIFNYTFADKHKEYNLKDYINYNA